MKRKGRHWVTQNLRTALCEFARVAEADLYLPRGNGATSGMDLPPTAQKARSRDGDSQRAWADEIDERR
jgi:hypothetical protein